MARLKNRFKGFTLYSAINLLAIGALVLVALVTIIDSRLNPDKDWTISVPARTILYVGVIVSLAALLFLENRATKAFQVLVILAFGTLSCLSAPLHYDFIGFWILGFLLAFGYGFIKSIGMGLGFLIAGLSIFSLSLMLHKVSGSRHLLSILFYMVFFIVNLVAILFIFHRKLEERAVLSKAEELNRFFSASLELYAITDLHGGFISLNQEWHRILGWSEAELQGQSLPRLCHPEDAEDFTNQFLNQNAGSRAGSFTGRFMHSDTSHRHLEWRFQLYGERIYASARDVSLRIAHENQLQENLKEKNILVNELYHRIKNTLQVISSILYLKSARHTDQSTSTLLMEINSRINTIAMAHHQLYKSNNLSRVNLRDYLDLISHTILRSISFRHLDIDFHFECPDENMLIDEAIPLGLLMNELLTNSCKFAFNDKLDEPDFKPSIYMEIEVQEALRLQARYGDNGSGLPATIDVKNPLSLGLSMVRSLCEYQLHGTLSIDQREGLQYTIDIPVNTYKERLD